MKRHITLKNVGWVLTGVVSFMLIKSGVDKVMATTEMVNNFAYVKLSSYLTIVGIMELLGVGLLLFPRTSGYGALLISTIMTAAATIHLSYMGGDKVLIPIMIGTLAWSAHCLRTYTK
jgi:hypothetical protein